MSRAIALAFVVLFAGAVATSISFGGSEQASMRRIGKPWELKHPS